MKKKTKKIKLQPKRKIIWEKSIGPQNTKCENYWTQASNSIEHQVWKQVDQQNETTNQKKIAQQ